MSIHLQLFATSGLPFNPKASASYHLLVILLWLVRASCWGMSDHGEPRCLISWWGMCAWLWDVNDCWRTTVYYCSSGFVLSAVRGVFIKKEKSCDMPFFYQNNVELILVTMKSHIWKRELSCVALFASVVHEQFKCWGVTGRSVLHVHVHVCLQRQPVDCCAPLQPLLACLYFFPRDGVIVLDYHQCIIPCQYCPVRRCPDSHRGSRVCMGELGAPDACYLCVIRITAGCTVYHIYRVQYILCTIKFGVYAPPPLVQYIHSKFGGGGVGCLLQMRTKYSKCTPMCNFVYRKHASAV